MPPDTTSGNTSDIETLVPGGDDHARARRPLPAVCSADTTSRYGSACRSASSFVEPVVSCTTTRAHGPRGRASRVMRVSLSSLSTTLQG